MEEKKLRFAFRLVHIDNIPHILKNGIVKADSPQANSNYVPIGDQLVIEKRKNRRLSSSSWQNIGDFIPFYFGPRSPMLYVIQHGYNGVRRIEAEDIVYCVIRLDDIIKDKRYSEITDKLLEIDSLIETRSYKEAKEDLIDLEMEVYKLKRLGKDFSPWEWMRRWSL